MEPASKLGRGKPLKNQTKEVIQKIYKYFESEIHRDRNSTVTASQLVTHATGISMYALKRVLSENKPNISKRTEHIPCKHRHKRNITFNDNDAQAIRRTIHNFYTKDEEFPTMRDLYLIFKADIDYQGSLFTLRRHVAKLGFKWTESPDRNSMLIEKHDVRFARIQYLSKLDIYRDQGRNIVYTSEISFESNRLSSRPKPDGSSTILKQPAKSRFVILLAGDNDGVMKNTLFVCDGTKKELKDEEYRKHNFDIYEKWFQYHFVPILKASSVVVIDSGSAFNNRLVNATPHSHSTRREMSDFLMSKNIPHSCNMFKPQLYHLVLTAKDKYSDYKTDVLLKNHGHTVLRLPAYYQDLNPVKNILSTLSDYIGKDVSLSVENVMKICKEKVSGISIEDWKRSCRMSEAEGNNLIAVDKIIDNISERTYRRIDETSSDTENSDINASDQDSIESD